MSENALTVRGEMSLADTMTLGDTLAKSGFFSDTQQAAQAVVKILAGRELGLGPIASMTGINIIKGKVALGSNLMATTVKRDPRYDYRVIEMTAERCEIVFFENGKELGRSEFSAGDAAKAGLSGDNWRKYPRNMLFARAMSNGVRWYCPDAFGGAPIYTPEEMGAEVDGETGDLIEMPTRRAARDVDHAADAAEAERELRDLRTPPVAARSWPSETINAVMDAGFAKPSKHAITMLGLSTVLRTTDEIALVLEWCNHYRFQRADGKSPEQSAAWADEQMGGITPAE